MNAVELTKELVAINSVNPFRTVLVKGREIGIGNESDINLYLEQLLQARGFKIQRQIVTSEHSTEIDGVRIVVPERWNVLAEKGEGSESILFFGHTDTVDVKPGWESDPFEVTERVVDGHRRLYGLGANDMKSGLAAVIAGIPETLPKGVKVKVALLADEEFWSFGGARLAESEFLDDVAFAISPEIGDFEDPAVGQQIGLGRLGRSEFVFSIVGRACHGADAFVDTDSVNAVHVSVALQNLLIEHCEKSRKSFDVEGIQALNAAYLNFHSGGRGMLSVPDTAECVLDRSFIPGEDPESELSELRSLVMNAQKEGVVDPRARITVSPRPRPTPACKPFYFPQSHTKIKCVENIISSLGSKTTYFIGRSVADENRIAERGIPTIVLGPLGHGSHTSHEWVLADSIELLREVVAGICQGGEKILAN